MLRICTWNVAGLRALLRKNPEAIPEIVTKTGANILALQETKLSHTIQVLNSLNLDPHIWQLPGFWTHSQKRAGLNGVGVILTREIQERVQQVHYDHIHKDTEFEGEGRSIVIELTGNVVLIALYVPNAGQKLARLDKRIDVWDRILSDYIYRLQQEGKQIIIVGDLNVAPAPIDIHNPERNLRSAGFTIEERESFARMMTRNNLVDVYRHLYPRSRAFTFFTYLIPRERNAGWRLDLFLVSRSLIPKVRACDIHSDVLGSDHVPTCLNIEA